MISFKDFEREDGTVDWQAHGRAEVAAGEKCYQCGDFILYSKGVRILCFDCNKATEDGELNHDRFLRCPKCRELWNPMDSEDYQVFQEDSHDVSCQECGHDFEVSTAVSYTFTSPAMVEDKS